ncbi:MAG: hypothetical protein DRP59_04330 [Spirochaetes bacterium]|nr:MAG: hypothetical protein DRP59_04330 [Spirochaetota bacterium]
MEKRIVTGLVLLVLMAMSAAANGVQKNSATNTWTPGRGQRYRMAPGNTQGITPPFEAGEKLILTGTLKFAENNEIELVTKDGTFDLMYPYYNTPNIDVKDGQNVTVKGYEVPAYRWSNGDDDKHLHVVEATIAGKTYSFENLYNMKPGSRTAGRMGGRMSSPGGGRTGRWNNNNMPRGRARR